MDQNVTELAAKALSAIQGDKSLLASFTSNPVKALESILGVDLPDEVVKKVIDTVKEKLTGGIADAVADATGVAKDAADNAKDAAASAADAIADKAKEGGSILGSAVDAIKKLF